MRAPVHDIHISNLLTYVALAAGISAITIALDSNNGSLAAVALGIAALADTFDGRFARVFERTPRQSRCGKEIDSLVDAVAFGVAPPVVLFASAGPLGTWEAALWGAAAVFYALAAVTRLAFYNVEDDIVGFVGTPTPAAALVCLTSLLWPTPGWTASWPLVVAGVAMIAPIPIRRPRATGLALFACWAIAVVGLHAGRL